MNIAFGELTNMTNRCTAHTGVLLGDLGNITNRALRNEMEIEPRDLRSVSNMAVNINVIGTQWS